MKGDVKTVVLVALGVVVAGLAMYYGKNIQLLDDAHQGFDRIG